MVCMFANRSQHRYNTFYRMFYGPDPYQLLMALPMPKIVTSEANFPAKASIHPMFLDDESESGSREGACMYDINKWNNVDQGRA